MLSTAQMNMGILLQVAGRIVINYSVYFLGLFNCNTDVTEWPYCIVTQFNTSLGYTSISEQKKCNWPEFIYQSSPLASYCAFK